MPQIIEVVERYEIPDFPDSSLLPTEDGIPSETSWHRIQMNLLIDIVHHHWHGRDDYFVGGNMFVYYSTKQVRNRDYKGPDFFLVKDVDGTHSRDKWVVWEEEGRYPNVIVELMSASTARADLTTKKELYAHTFHTANYFAYDPLNKRLYGWHNPQDSRGYEEIEPDEDGWLWSSQLNAWVGLWQGTYQKVEATWVRLYDRGGQLILTRAEAAEAEAASLRAELQRLRRDD